MSSPIEYTVKVYPSGTRSWYLDGKLHREDGPACEFANGYRAWYLDGKLHRADGPAYEYADCSREWRLDGKEVSEEEHRRLTSGNNADVLARIEAAERELEAAKQAIW